MLGILTYKTPKGTTEINQNYVTLISVDDNNAHGDEIKQFTLKIKASNGHYHN